MLQESYNDFMLYCVLKYLVKNIVQYRCIEYLTVKKQYSPKVFNTFTVLVQQYCLFTILFTNTVKLLDTFGEYCFFTVKY